MPQVSHQLIDVVLLFRTEAIFSTIWKSSFFYSLKKTSPPFGLMTQSSVGTDRRLYQIAFLTSLK
jgi:hypothetical protein